MKTLFCILFCFFSFLMSEAVCAKSFESTYEAQGMNMVLLSADISIETNQTGYMINTHSYARGILSLFIDSETIFQTRGKFEQNRLKIIDSVMKNKKRKYIRTTQQNFNEKQGFIDYQSILIELMRLSDVQSHTFYVSDGKRDMRITLTYEGKRDLSEINSGLTGQADAYSVQIDVIAGKKKGWFFERMRESQKSPLRLYMQADEQIGEKTLIAATFDTGVIGKLYIVRKELKNVQN